MVAAWTREHDAEDVVRRMRDAEVPVAKAYTIADIFADPHYRARGMLARVEHPRLGSVTLPGAAAAVRDAGRDPRARAPARRGHRRGLARRSRRAGGTRRPAAGGGRGQMNAGDARRHART